MVNNRTEKRSDDVLTEEMTKAAAAEILEKRDLSALFNRKALSTLALLFQELFCANTQLAEENKDSLIVLMTAWATHLAKSCDNEWPAPEPPADPEEMGERARITHERALAAYKKEKAIFDRQRPAALRWFVQQALKSFPGRRDNIDNPEIRASLPDPVLQEDYPQYARALKWYLSDKPEDADKLRTVQDLKDKTLHDIQAAYNEVFTGDITDMHLVRCDKAFLDQPIPQSAPLLERHPDIENVTTHAEIIAQGTCEDGMGWTMRRLNSREAAMAYGNPSGKPNGSNLCFTWEGDRSNYFHDYRRDLMMLCRNDGTKARFIHVRHGAYMNAQDTPLDPETVLNDYPGSNKALMQPLKDEILSCLKDGKPEDEDDFFDTILSFLNLHDFEDPRIVEAIPDILRFLSRYEYYDFFSEGLSVIQKMLACPPCRKNCEETLPEIFAAMFVENERTEAEKAIRTLASSLKNPAAFAKKLTENIAGLLQNEDVWPDIGSVTGIIPSLRVLDEKNCDRNFAKLARPLLEASSRYDGREAVYTVSDDIIFMPQSEKAVTAFLTEEFLREFQIRLNNSQAILEEIEDHTHELDFSKTQKKTLVRAAIEKIQNEKQWESLPLLINFDGDDHNISGRSLKSLFNGLVQSGRHHEDIAESVAAAHNTGQHPKVMARIIPDALEALNEAGMGGEIQEVLTWVSYIDEWKETALALAEKRSTDPALKEEIKWTLNHKLG